MYKQFQKEERENENYLAIAEYQVIKLLIEHPELDYFELSDLSFPHKTARSIYKAVTQLQESGEQINYSSLLREANSLNDKVDSITIQNILDIKVDPSNLDKALETLFEASIKYKLNLKVDDFKDKLLSNDPLEKDYALLINSEIQDIIAQGKKNNQALTLEEAFDEYKLELELRKQGKDYPFADDFLNANLTRKGSPGQIILIAGGTGTGKSAYGLYLINGDINIAMPSLYFTLEMDKISIMDRLVAMRTGIPMIDWYQKGNAQNALIKKVETEKQELANRPFWIIDETVSLYQVQNYIKEFKSRYKSPYARVYIDLITMVPEFMDFKRGTLANSMEKSVNHLNEIAKKENVCIVAFAQMNREPETLSSGVTGRENVNKIRPQLHHIKNSHALAERSRTVLGCFRPKYHLQRLFADNPEIIREVLSMDDIFQLQILKQSQGGVGKIGTYLFDGPTSSMLFQIEEEIQENTEQGTENLQY